MTHFALVVGDMRGFLKAGTHGLLIYVLVGVRTLQFGVKWDKLRG